MFLIKLPSVMLFPAPQWAVSRLNEESQSRRRIFTLRWETSPETPVLVISGRAGLRNEDVLRRGTAPARTSCRQSQMPHLEIGAMSAWWKLRNPEGFS